MRRREGGGDQGCQIGPCFPPNLTSSAARGCQIGQGFPPNLATLASVTIFSLLSMSSSKGQNYSGEMHFMPRRQASFNVCQVNEPTCPRVCPPSMQGGAAVPTVGNFPRSAVRPGSGVRRAGQRLLAEDRQWLRPRIHSPCRRVRTTGRSETSYERLRKVPPLLEDFLSPL